MNQRVLDSLPVERETTIREMFQNHPKRRLRERALMIILSSQGLCVKQIADILKLRVCPEIKFLIFVLQVLYHVMCKTNPTQEPWNEDKGHDRTQSCRSGNQGTL